MSQAIYGSGTRLMECVRLRIKDVGFGQGKIFIRGGKGGKDRTTFLPLSPKSANNPKSKVLNLFDGPVGYPTK